MIEDFIARELKYGINLLGSVIPLVQESVAPVFKVANELQSSIGNINTKMDEYAKYGIHKLVFCVNAENRAIAY